MRFRVMTVLAFHSPRWFWRSLPFDWRFWWAGEYSRRRYPHLP